MGVAQPCSPIYCDLIITGSSAATALIVGGAGLARLLGKELGATSGPLAWTGKIGFEYVGYGIVALFLTTWMASAAVWRFGRIKERLHPQHRLQFGASCCEYLIGSRTAELA